MSTLIHNNSGFGWDPIAKTLTASDEVWKDYLKSHPSHCKLRENSLVDYEDLKIVVGGGTATGNGSIALGVDDTNATTYGVEENYKDFGMEDFLDNLSSMKGVLAQLGPTIKPKISNLTEKRDRDRELNEMEKRERERKNNNICEAIKKIPNLDDNTRYMTGDLLNTKAKNDFFLKMSPEERSF
ncbi:hypothetical protein CerSpe_242910 [Prunus speciosa]